jgi:hypothetical protein
MRCPNSTVSNPCGVLVVEDRCPSCGIRYGYHLASCHALSDGAEAREPSGMRAAFMAWVKDRGCDTDGAWSAWQACWNLLQTHGAQERKRPASGAALPLPPAGPTGSGGWCEMCGVTHEGPHPAGVLEGRGESNGGKTPT